MSESLARRISLSTLDALNSYGFPGADRALLESFVDPPRALLSGGKRVRGLLSLAGAMCATGEDATEEAIGVAAAIELFQGAALVHDDIMDDSPTRRGQPAVHIRFGSDFDDSDLVGDAQEFGINAGICSGDFLLALAGSHMLKNAPPAANHRFHAMCAEVAFGQFLDVRAESIDLSDLLGSADPAGALRRARDDAFTVLRHKSAHYSVRDPLLIGAEAAGADADLLDLLSEIGTPLGEAFQLRDDALGIAGDPSTTGKPTGGDLREGKRTVLILTALERLAGSDEARWIADSLGRDISDDEARRISGTIVACGAWEEHEGLIAVREQQAEAAWDRLPAGRGRDALGALLAMLTDREH